MEILRNIYYMARRFKVAIRSELMALGGVEDVAFSNFAERAAVPWWLFPLSLLCVGGATLSTVALQAWRAANANPIASIKG